MRSVLQKIIFCCFLLLSLMKSSDLFRVLKCFGPISLTLFMSSCSAVLVGGCVSFDLESLVNNYLQVAWQKSQVDLIRVGRSVRTLVWERTHSFWCPAIHSVLKVLGQKHSTEKKKNPDIPSPCTLLNKAKQYYEKKEYYYLKFPISFV